MFFEHVYQLRLLSILLFYLIDPSQVRPPHGATGIHRLYSSIVPDNGKACLMQNLFPTNSSRAPNHPDVPLFSMPRSHLLCPSTPPTLLMHTRFLRLYFSS